MHLRMQIAINKSRTNIKKYLCLITNNPTRYWHHCISTQWWHLKPTKLVTPLCTNASERINKHRDKLDER